jgi:hypothetical protein
MCGDVGKDDIEVTIRFSKPTLLKLLGLDRGGQEIVSVEEDSSGELTFRLFGRFPVWAKAGDDLVYVWPGNSLCPTLVANMEYVSELQAAIVEAQREVDRRWQALKDLE